MRPLVALSKNVSFDVMLYLKNHKEEDGENQQLEKRETKCKCCSILVITIRCDAGWTHSDTIILGCTCVTMTRQSRLDII